MCSPPPLSSSGGLTGKHGRAHPCVSPGKRRDTSRLRGSSWQIPAHSLKLFWHRLNKTLTPPFRQHSSLPPPRYAKRPFDYGKLRIQKQREFRMIFAWRCTLASRQYDRVEKTRVPASALAPRDAGRTQYPGPGRCSVLLRCNRSYHQVQHTPFADEEPRPGSSAESMRLAL